MKYYICHVCQRKKVFSAADKYEISDDVHSRGAIVLDRYYTEGLLQP